MHKIFKSPQNLLILILLLTTFLRLFRLDYPKNYVFDEVYHAFTAKEYIKGSKEAWEWWTKPPPGVAFEWTHPPLAKEIMGDFMLLSRSTDSWAYRLPGALLGIISVYLVYYLGVSFFKKESIGLISAFVFSLDGLNFVQSRTGMNDIYLVTFILLSLTFFIHQRFFLSSLFLGLALASKWTGIYLLGLYLVIYLVIDFLYLINHKKINLTLLKQQLISLIYLIFIPIMVYLLSYLPFFLLGHTKDQFIELQKQMWWYHTGLKASHDYASAWWSWPFNLYPVWYFVEYKNNQIANIFASGNPVMLLFGFMAILYSAWEAVKKRFEPLLIVILGYLTFILPWAISPRIMFLYHYSPCIPFLSLALGYQLNKYWEDKNLRSTFYLMLGLIVLGFIFIYPYITGILLPKDLVLLFFRSNLTKNPFGG